MLDPNDPGIDCGCSAGKCAMTRKQQEAHMALTVKQEGFVQDVARGMTLAAAYRNNYDVGADCLPTTVWVNASKLMADAKVTQRLAEIQEAATHLTLVTIHSITVELEAARQLALAGKQPAAMTSASMGKAKVNGLLVDKQEAKHEIADPVKELFAQIAARGRRIGCDEPTNRPGRA